MIDEPRCQPHLLHHARRATYNSTTRALGSERRVVTGLSSTNRGWMCPSGIRRFGTSVLSSLCDVSRAEATPDSERAALSEFLDMQREALINKLEGVSDEDARRAPTASSLSLLSLVKHSAIWERRWFQIIVAGRSFPGEWPGARTDEPDSTFHLTDEDTVETVATYYRQQIAVSRQILGTFDLDAACAFPEMAHQNLRWVALHMIEETARHAGHADIIRETIDGSRGR